MLKKLTTTTITVATLSLATYANANSAYVFGGNVGWAAQHAKSSLTVDSVALDYKTNDHGAHSLTVGYNTDINQDWAIGATAGYGQYGYTEWRVYSKSSPEEVRATQSAWFLLAGASYRIADPLSAFFKAGAAYGKTAFDLTEVTTGPLTETNYHNTRPMTALGINYTFYPNVGLNLQWEYIFGSDITSTNGDKFQTVNAYMAGLTYTLDTI